jgi:hypothetical protein
MFRTTAYSPEWLTYFNLRPSEDPIELRRAARCTVQLSRPINCVAGAYHHLQSGQAPVLTKRRWQVLALYSNHVEKMGDVQGVLAVQGQRFVFGTSHQ